MYTTVDFFNHEEIWLGVTNSQEHTWITALPT